MPANQTPTIQPQQPKTPKQITHNHQKKKKIPWINEVEREWYMEVITGQIDFQLKSKLELLPQQIWWKNSKTLTHT